MMHAPPLSRAPDTAAAGAGVPPSMARHRCCAPLEPDRRKNTEGPDRENISHLGLLARRADNARLFKPDGPGQQRAKQLAQSAPSVGELSEDWLDYPASADARGCQDLQTRPRARTFSTGIKAPSLRSGAAQRRPSHRLLSAPTSVSARVVRIALRAHASSLRGRGVAAGRRRLPRRRARSRRRAGPCA